LTIRLRDAIGAVVAERSWELSELARSHEFHSALRPLVVNIGKDLQLAASLGGDRTALPDDAPSRLAAVHVEDLATLPTHYLGYESAESVVVALDESLGQLSPDQLRALGRWVELGGHLVWTSGRSAEVVPRLPAELADLLPAPVIDIVPLQDSARLELIVAARGRVGGRDSPPVELARTEIPSRGRHTDVDGFPLISDVPRGLGRITFTALDPTASPIAEWSSRNKLLALILDRPATPTERDSRQRSGRVSHVGYEDLAGQLRTALDQFRNVTMVNFTWVAVAIGLFILFVGPGDFFLLRRLIGTMEFTWLTLPAAVVAFGLAAWWIAGRTRSATIEVNQIDIVDIDVTSGTVRGTSWSAVYSPRTIAPGLQLDHSAAPFSCDVAESWLTWFGLPGPGIGGLESRAPIGLTSVPYWSRFEAAGAPEADGSAFDRLVIGQSPFETGSTRMLDGTWWGHSEGASAGRLYQTRVGGPLRGTVTNPFDVPLEECVVLFERWAYVLDRPLAGGESVDLAAEMKERELAGYYTRRYGAASGGSREGPQPWNSRSVNLPQIVEIMMVFDSIGGADYTRMSSAYQDRIDLSHQLQLGRALLCGRVRGTTAPLTIVGADVPVNRDQQWTIARWVLDVELRADSANP